MTCSNCSFKCQATECECICHTQEEAFNYGKRDTIKLIAQKVRDMDLSGRSPDYCQGVIAVLEILRK